MSRDISTLAGATYRVDTYGCQMNAHESEKISGMLEGMGLVAADDGGEPDVLVLNTCCVRDSAEQRIIGHIGTLKRRKEENPRMLVCVAGCLSQQEGAADRLCRTFPFLDVVLGTHTLARLPEAIAERLDTGRRVVLVEEEATGLPEEGPMRRTPGPLSQVNIMYGCDNFCAYCIVPHVRGRERSRSALSVLEEVRTLSRAGYSEVTLLGQNVNSFRDEDGVDFPSLLSLVARECGMRRVRFMTSHPKDLSDRLIEVISAEPAVCGHVHLPVQAGSDRVLAAMNRGYSSDGYLSLISRLREAVPDVAITTDIIVGFPGETEEDFQRTLDLVEAARFDSAFTFVYSPRRGTRAATMEGQVPKEVKKDRIMRLIELQNAISREIGASLVGRVEHVLVEGPSARGQGAMAGRTEQARMVNFPGSKDLMGRIVPVLVTEQKSNTLVGHLAEEV